MQENRAFDHYYGTMARVRGFKDPNVSINTRNDLPNWYQPSPSGKAQYLLPFQLAAKSSCAGSNQCMTAVSNDWTPNLNAWNNGTITGWATGNSPYSWGSFKRSEIRTRFNIVEGWAVADIYAESVISPINPNRVTWISGSMDAGNNLGPGGPYIENNEKHRMLVRNQWGGVRLLSPNIEDLP